MIVEVNAVHVSVCSPGPPDGPVITSVPPVPVVGSDTAAGDALTILVIPISTVPFFRPPDNCTEATASIPCGIAVEFRPYATHVVAPESPLHRIVLPAAIAAGPGVRLTEVMSLDE